MPQHIIDKIWNTHVVTQNPGHPAILGIDLQMTHEVTSPQGFAKLEEKGLSVKFPHKQIATLDHSIPTRKDRENIHDPVAKKQVNLLRTNTDKTGIQLYDYESGHQGIVHVIGPELGLTQPGMTIVCGDSHTATHGAFGALAFGVGSTEVGLVLATGCILQQKPKTYRVEFTGDLPPGVYSKDLILYLISKIGVGGGTGHIFEYTGSAIRQLSMSARMSICNMSIEGGARAGLISPDEKTLEWIFGLPANTLPETDSYTPPEYAQWLQDNLQTLKKQQQTVRRYAPKPEQWPAAAHSWLSFRSEPDATYDQQITIDVSQLEPMITWGTNPGQGMLISDNIPTLKELSTEEQNTLQKALDYTQLEPGQKLEGQPLDWVFIGSCTNARLEDLRIVASFWYEGYTPGDILTEDNFDPQKVNHINPDTIVYIVPGSEEVKAQAEAEGLDKIFTAAGASWRNPGCSMCLGMNDDKVPRGERCLSTSNRNFMHRQGPGAITHLASPATAAVSALQGKITSPAKFTSP